MTQILGIILIVFTGLFFVFLIMEAKKRAKFKKYRPLLEAALVAKGFAVSPDAEKILPQLSQDWPGIVLRISNLSVDINTILTTFTNSAAPKQTIMLEEHRHKTSVNSFVKVREYWLIAVQDLGKQLSEFSIVPAGGALSTQPTIDPKRQADATSKYQGLRVYEQVDKQAEPQALLNPKTVELLQQYPDYSFALFKGKLYVMGKIDFQPNLADSLLDAVSKVAASLA